MPQVIRSKSDLKNLIKKLKNSNATIGLVPTMGALHQGHLALVDSSTQTYDVTIVTIFVNPAQFNNKEDLAQYPQTETEDIEKLSETSCDYVFIPTVSEIYPKEPLITLNFGYLEQILEGLHRPGHFNGVGIIVMKLFGLVEPHGAFFGQKDLQQFTIISTLIKDFDLPIKLHMVPIVRESNGLAMSSRNKRLSKTELQIASLIYDLLVGANKHLQNGVSVSTVLKNTISEFKKSKGLVLEYFEIVEAESLMSKSVVNEGDRLALCAAAMVGNVRLIDNIIIDI